MRRWVRSGKICNKREKKLKCQVAIGVKETDTGLAPPNLWDIPADKQRMSEEQPLQVNYNLGDSGE